MREFEDGERNDGGLVREEKDWRSDAAGVFWNWGGGDAGGGRGEMAWAADTKSEVPRRTLGRTGEKVSMVGLVAITSQPEGRAGEHSHHSNGAGQ